MIVSCKTESFLPHSASLGFIFYLRSVILTHTEKFKQHCPLMTVTDVGPIRHLAVLTAAKWLKNKLEALVVSRADRKPERKLAIGSWQAPSQSFPGNFSPVEKMMRRRGDEGGSRVSQQKEIYNKVEKL